MWFGEEHLCGMWHPSDGGEKKGRKEEGKGGRKGEGADRERYRQVGVETGKGSLRRKELWQLEMDVGKGT